MKKLCLIASILPVFGCNHFEAKEPLENVTVESPFRDDRKNETASEKSYTQRGLDQPLNHRINKEVPNEQIENSTKSPVKGHTLLDVVLISQNPELKFGCEVTSLAMMLHYAGVPTNKMDLYHAIEKDPDPLIKSPTGDILHWGNPASGFVGDMTGRRPGYAVFDKPMINLINQKLPGRAVNLTGQPFEQILQHVSNGFPVVVWTTGDFRLPDRWEAWNHGKEQIKTPLDLHVVLLVGYDADYVYLNDPLSGRKHVKVDKRRFISSWHALQSRAVSYK
ncbi:C39 family peptidase [Neobacillus sp. LXY-1]|uniref:C39 family peptidase n=1 Tax=Neobacillus sp. LXY-1 TaxID=3379133 RepID=UPI003EE01787